MISLSYDWIKCEELYGLYIFMRLDGIYKILEAILV